MPGGREEERYRGRGGFETERVGLGLCGSFALPSWGEVGESPLGFVGHSGLFVAVGGEGEKEAVDALGWGKETNGGEVGAGDFGGVELTEPANAASAGGMEVSDEVFGFDLKPKAQGVPFSLARLPFEPSFGGVFEEFFGSPRDPFLGGGGILGSLPRPERGGRRRGKRGRGRRRRVGCGGRGGGGRRGGCASIKSEEEGIFLEDDALLLASKQAREGVENEAFVRFSLGFEGGEMFGKKARFEDFEPRLLFGVDRPRNLAERGPKAIPFGSPPLWGKVGREDGGEGGSIEGRDGDVCKVDLFLFFRGGRGRGRGKIVLGVGREGERKGQRRGNGKRRGRRGGAAGLGGGAGEKGEDALAKPSLDIRGHVEKALFFEEGDGFSDAVAKGVGEFQADRFGQVGCVCKHL